MKRARLTSWFVNTVVASELVSSPVRCRIMRMLGMSIGQAVIQSHCKFYGNLSNVEIGNGSYINHGCQMFGTGGIRLGSNVFLGPNVVIMTGSHRIGSGVQRAMTPTEFHPVEVADGSWLGEGVLVQGGVSIAEGCVFAARTVVTVSTEPHGLYAGTPANRKRSLS